MISVTDSLLMLGGNWDSFPPCINLALSLDLASPCAYTSTPGKHAAIKMAFHAIWKWSPDEGARLMAGLMWHCASLEALPARSGPHGT